ncbi:hypothetical protein [Acinetobacter lactucae]|uniref:hypothetical protein n=1 Tax=Acinetobacter lactucae TaxID=1785128 RepID=UPI001F246434|nr:hypothetical protein [Acinetobacter lactucae]
MTTTTVRLNHTSSSGTRGDGRDQKEKFIDYCEYKYFLPDSQKWGVSVKTELTQAEIVEKQKCHDAINNPFTSEYYLLLCLIIITIIFFTFCNMKGYLSIKRRERETGIKANISFEMKIISLVSFLLTLVVAGILYVLYFLYLNYKYQY